MLGIPVTLKQPVTKYDEALEILTELKNKGVEDMVVSYNGWTNDGIRRKVDTGASPSGTLGGKSSFNKLTDFIGENGFEFYPASSSRDFYSGNGYYSFTSTCVRVSGSYSRIVSYDRAYGIPDGFKKNMSLLLWRGLRRYRVELRKGGALGRGCGQRGFVALRRLRQEGHLPLQGYDTG